MLINTTEGQIAAESKKGELKLIQNQIKGIQLKIQQAKIDIDLYLNELQENEKLIMDITINHESIEHTIKNQLNKLMRMKNQSVEQKRILDVEQKLLADQIRMAYKTGQHNLLKLLLNQEDPGKIGRMITYNDFYNRARTKKISKVKIALSNLREITLSINVETKQLELLKKEQLDKLEQLSSYRHERNEIIDNLNQYVSDQDRILQTLQQDEQELLSLLKELKSTQDFVKLFEELPPFDTLKGQLNWPVSGDIITHFGAVTRGGKLRSNGVKISTKLGKNVAAISGGKVIFADWFRNLGLLIIIDHGNGYMSLYGHNERLLKKTNDFVKIGDAIAKVGNTGGQSKTALYFEIRQEGSPLNPELWFQK